jgi:hypothetical protein
MDEAIARHLARATHVLCTNTLVSIDPTRPKRSRILLLAADGLRNKQIAEQMEIAPRMASLWRGPFLQFGIEGLLKEAKRPGRTPSILAQGVAELDEKTA